MGRSGSSWAWDGHNRSTIDGLDRLIAEGLTNSVCYAAAMARPERRIVLTGESPVQGSAGAPGSRLRSRGEIRAARRSVKSPCKREEQTNALQQSVNPIASTNYQPKGFGEALRCIGPVRNRPGLTLHPAKTRLVVGPVQYPAQSTPRRSSLSRVPDGTHGLKGDAMETGQRR